MTLFIRRRWSVVAAICLFMLLLQVVEIITDNRSGIQSRQVFDAVLYGIGVPAGAWLLLTLLAGVEKERTQANFTRNLQAEFSQKLGDTEGWENLVQEIIAFAHQALPQSKITLSVMHPQAMCLRVEAEGTQDGQITLKPNNYKTESAPQPGARPDPELQVSPLPGSRIYNASGAGTSPSEISSHSAAIDQPPDLSTSSFELPIARGHQKIGVMKVEYPLNRRPAAADIRVVESMLPLMALALDGALLQSLAADQAAASDAERQKIVQDLHDTLAQNISYLRLKLDQLTGENAIHEISVVLQELERMRATADEAYQQVRNTIDELAIPNGEDLKTTIEHQARVISSRAGFDLHIRQIGDARALPTVTRQHILNISREALHNVEKHAHATQAGLQFIWLEAELILKITDNGVGFHPQPDHDEGHYGLWIMQQRARDIGGMVKISPADGQGTEVTLWVPYLKSAH